METTSQAIAYERKHECDNGHTWSAQVVLSDHATGLSGELRQYCPKCGQRAFVSHPATPLKKDYT